MNINERFALSSTLEFTKDVPRELINELGLLGEYSSEILGLASLNNSTKGYICFCDREPAAEITTISDGTIVLTNPELHPMLVKRYPNGIFVTVRDPRAAFIDLAARLMAEEKLDVTDAVPRPLKVDHTASVGLHTVIHPEVRIDEGVIIGNQCVIHRGVWIKENTVIRDHAVIGCEGINAYRGLDGRQRGFPHLASVIIGRNTEIGAGVIIPRGILTSTIIGNQVVVGNLCNIGHGSVICDNVWMSVGCRIGGHTVVGRRATLGMGVVVRDNIDIGDEAQVGMGSVVVRNVEHGSSVFGNPARTTGGKLRAGPER